MSPHFRVLGIALVVEELGKGARLIFRYPLAPPKISDGNNNRNASTNMAEEDENENTCPSDRDYTSSTQDNKEDLFFTLPPRVMAKLFRPKKPLCGQPMTISVGGTVFCCRAVLFESTNNTFNDSDVSSTGDDKSNSGSAPNINCGSNSDTDNSSKIVLFSVIVALAPTTRIAELFGDEVSAAGQRNNNITQRRSSSAISSGSNKSTSSSRDDDTASPEWKGSSEMITSGPSIYVRRVHVSLARLCRVLEREENRCQYVSIQSSRLIQIRAKMGADRSEGPPANNDHSAAGKKREPASSSGAVSSATPAPPGSRLGSTSGVVGTGGSVSGSVVDTKDHRKLPSDSNILEAIIVDIRQELELEIIEIMLAANVASVDMIANGDNNYDDTVGNNHTGAQQSSQQHYGNLARELAQFFHALSRNDQRFVPTPTGLVSGRDGIVYVNRHIAVPVEALSTDQNHPSTRSRTKANEPAKSVTAMSQEQQCNITEVRPYHTLLFPNTSPSELLETLRMASMNNHHTTQRLQAFVLMSNPRKSLSDIAADAALPLPVAKELAAYLIKHKVCIVTPVINRTSRLVCSHDAILKMQRLSLDFCHHFGPKIPIFIVVSVITTDGITLGETMSRVSLSSFLSHSSQHSSEHEDSDDATYCTPQDRMLGDRIATTLHQTVLPSGLQAVNKGMSNRRDIPLTHGGDPLSPHHLLHHHHHDAAINPHNQRNVRSEDIEEALYAMAVWLRSQRVIVEMRDYFVSITPLGSISATPATGTAATSPPGLSRMPSDVSDAASAHSDVALLISEGKAGRIITTGSSTTTSNNSRAVSESFLYNRRETSGIGSSAVRPEETLYQELLEANCLNGNISTIALCWRFGLDARRLRRFRFWALNNNKIRVISRVRKPSDDWGAA